MRKTLNVKEKIIFARMIIAQKYPFFSYLLHFLKTEPATWLPYKTMATNGKTIYYDEKFIESRSNEEVIFCLCHEILHILHKHVNRQSDHKLDVWGVAADFVVNDILLSQNEKKWMKPYSDMVYNPQYHDMSVEAVYDDLIKKGFKGLPFDNHMGSHPNLKEDLDETWNARAYMAYQYAKQHGKTPEGLEKFLKGIIEPSVNWRVVLQNYINQFHREDYSWSRPNRMHLYRGLILPSAYSEEMGTIVLVIDTSGSISEEQLKQMVAEAQCIRNSYPMTLHIVICDAKVHSHYTLEKYGFFDTDKIKLKGGGGTDFRPAFEYINKQKWNPTAIIYLTDGNGTYPKNVKYPVLWTLTKDHHKPPFGKKVVMS